MLIFGIKNPLSFSLKSRTNLIAAATVVAGFVKMFWPALVSYAGDPLGLITAGLGLIYLREAKDAG